MPVCATVLIDINRSGFRTDDGIAVASAAIWPLIAKENERRRGLILGGLITFVVGAGVIPLLYGLETEKPVWLAGLIPLLIGAVLFLYGVFSPRGERPGAGAPPQPR